MIRALLVVAILAGCGGSVATPAEATGTPTTPTPAPSPYEYPDLPGNVEGTIAEGDCDDLEVVAEFMDRDSVDPVVRHQAMEAIVHRSEELGCE